MPPRPRTLSESIAPPLTILRALPRWREIPEPTVRPWHGAGVSRLGTLGGLPVLLLEASVRDPCPPYAARHSLHRRLAPAHSSILVFTDAARSTYVWSWFVRDGVAPHRVEHRLPRREDTLRAALCAPGRLHPRPPVRDADAKMVFRAVRERWSQGSIPTPNRLDRVPDWLASLQDGGAIRAVWRGIVRIRVLDPDCHRGDWLLGVASVLESLYLWTFERVRSLIDEPSTETGHPGRMGDLRALVDDPLRPGPERDRTLLIRRLIAENNLFGYGAIPSDIEGCRRRLLRYAGRTGDAIPHLDVNIVPMPDPNLRVRGRSAPRVGAARNPRRPRIGIPPASDVQEEIDVYRSAWRAARLARAAGHAGAAECAVAAELLAGRRSRIERDLATSSAVSGSLVRALDFPGLAPASGFDLVRRLNG